MRPDSHGDGVGQMGSFMLRRGGKIVSVGRGARARAAPATVSNLGLAGATARCTLGSGRVEHLRLAAVVLSQADDPGEPPLRTASTGTISLGPDGLSVSGADRPRLVCRSGARSAPCSRSGPTAPISALRPAFKSFVLASSRGPAALLLVEQPRDLRTRGCPSRRDDGRGAQGELSVPLAGELRRRLVRSCTGSHRA